MRVMVMHQYFDHNSVDFNLVIPRFEEGMRFSLAEIDAIHEMLHMMVGSLFHKCQEIGVEFKDRFKTYELNIDGNDDTKSTKQKRK